MSELERIVAATREELRRRADAVSLAELERTIGPRPQAAAGRFPDALAQDAISVIAEHKRRSPSAGLIRAGVSLEDVVRSYERGGAAALSILTEGPSFGGSLEDLRAARAATRLPLLRKDFVIDRYQVYEALAAGADAVLLIVAALPAAELAALHALAHELGLAALVEVHDEAELDAALAVEPQLIGINNRDLTTLAVDTRRTFELLPRVPSDTVVVAESGFRTRAELDERARAAVDAVLVGEALMRAANIEDACRVLTGSP
jgi:indole-3-glycerol phosphate synthase